MKRFLISIMILLATTLSFAQTEDTGGTLPDFDSQRYKDFDGFILDMGSMLDMPAWLMPPTLSYRPFGFSPSSPYKLNPDAVKINTDITFKGGVPGMSLLQSFRSLYNPGYGNVNWQGASYKLKNGMRINTYGEYNADGYKVYNPSAMPWERNNFNAAFEIKSANGNFGIRVEMQGGRNNPF